MREPYFSARMPTRFFSFPFSPMTEQVVLGFDFGTRRIGVALGNSITRRARPLSVVAATPLPARWNAISAVLQEWQPTWIVVGLPRHPDGAQHEMTRRAQRFGNQLHGRYGLPVVFVDERYSSAVLERAGSNDADAAAVILQQWLDEQTEPGAPVPALPPHAGEGGFESSRCTGDEDK